jgi:hypothetical protein
MSDKPVTTWEAAADDVFAVLFAESEARRWARFDAGLRAAHFPEPHKTAITALFELDDAGKPIHDTTLAAHCDGRVLPGWISTRVCLYDELRTGPVFRDNVRLVMNEGLKVGTKSLLSTAITELDKGAKRETVVNTLMAVLANLNIDKGIKGETAAAMGQKYRLRLTQPAAPLRSTGIEWFDGLTGGYQDAMLWWIASAYKQRKTTLLLNMLLAAAVQGEMPALLSGEMTQEQVYWQLISMLAVLNLYKRGKYADSYKASDGKTYPLNMIYATGLRNAQDSYKRWHAEKVKAIDWALDFYETLNIRIYDSTDDLGGLVDLDSIKRVVSFDMARHGGRRFFGDYIQLFDVPGSNMTEKEQAKARGLQQMTRALGITMLWAAQQNEEGVKGSGSSYSPSVAGGGAVPQTADFLLITKYQRKDDEGIDTPDTELTINMKLSRHGPMNISQTFDIHPGSGLLLGQSWFSRVGVE